jgi:purine-binding chemotaxis protein CheW
MSTQESQLAAGVLPAAGPPPALDESEEADQYLTFAIAGETFAMSVRQVREVLDLKRIAKIANAPPLLLGMIDVRGTGVPVIDLKRKLALPAGETTEHSRILVLEVEQEGRQLVIAAVADAVYEVAHLPAEGVEPPPEFGQNWDNSFIRGIGRREGTFVTLLDLGRLFGSADFAVLEQAS